MFGIQCTGIQDVAGKLLGSVFVNYVVLLISLCSCWYQFQYFRQWYWNNVGNKLLPIGFDLGKNLQLQVPPCTCCGCFLISFATHHILVLFRGKSDIIYVNWFRATTSNIIVTGIWGNIFTFLQIRGTCVHDVTLNVFWIFFRDRV